MNTQSNATPHSPAESPVVAPVAISEARRLYWSVRRELWEYRSIYVAPLSAAALFLFGFLIGTIGLPARMRHLAALDPASAPGDRRRTTWPRFDHAHCADRRRCSIVSTRCMASAAIAASSSGSRCRFPTHHRAVEGKHSPGHLPSSHSASPLSTQLVMLLLSSAVLLASGLNVETLWTQLPLCKCRCCCSSTSLGCIPSGTRPSMVGCSWSQLGAARGISLGNSAVGGDRDRRKSCVQHLIFRRHAAAPAGRRHQAVT